jgi:adenine-specific DNA-methyltransferase
MATGVPKRNWKSRATVPALSGWDGLELTWPDKRPVSELLHATPARPVEVWSSDSAVDRVACDRLFFGNNLGVLATLVDDRNTRGKVQLIYADPPYATNSVFQSKGLENAYADMLVGASYLEFLRERLALMRELLSDDGSIYLHLDENMVFHVKVVMDEIFGRKAFRNCITRRKCSSKNYTHRSYGNVVDYILFYARGSNPVWNRPRVSWQEDHALKEYPYVEEGTGRRFKKVPVHAPGVRKGETGKPWRGVPPPHGRHWKCSPKDLDRLDSGGLIYWSANGNPRKKVYFDESKGLPLNDIWLDCRDAHNQNIHITGYPTEKNLGLLQRVVAASSEPAGLVLDPFCGSGTTLVAARDLGRRWIGIDESEQALTTAVGRLLYGTQAMKDHVATLKRRGKNRAPAQIELWSRAHHSHFVVLAESQQRDHVRELLLAHRAG